MKFSSVLRVIKIIMDLTPMQWYQASDLKQLICLVILVCRNLQQCKSKKLQASADHFEHSTSAPGILQAFEPFCARGVGCLIVSQVGWGICTRSVKFVFFEVVRDISCGSTPWCIEIVGNMPCKSK